MVSLPQNIAGRLSYFYKESSRINLQEIYHETRISIARSLSPPLHPPHPTRHLCMHTLLTANLLILIVCVFKVCIVLSAPYLFHFQCKFKVCIVLSAPYLFHFQCKFYANRELGGQTLWKPTPTIRVNGFQIP